MATTTARDMIQKAMQKLGILAEGETATGQQMADGLDSLNLMLDSWAVDSLLTSAQIQSGFAITSANNSYAIGANQTFNTTKPHSIVGAFLRDSANQDSGVDVVNRDIYNSKGDKNTSGIPSLVFYDPGATQNANASGTVYVYPKPDANYTLYLEMEQPFTSLANLNANITFPSGYKRAIIYNLAIEIAPEYGVAASAELVKIASDSKRLIETINIANKEQSAGIAFPGQLSGGYNIETDE